MNIFERREKPKLTGLERASECGDSILTRERLFWIRLRIIQRIARIEGARSKIITKVRVPLVGASTSSDNDRTTVRARSVGIELRGAHYKFLHRVRRIVLEKASDVIIVVVATVYGEIQVETGTATKSDRCYARLGWI